MDLLQNKQGSALTVSLSGRLDTATAPLLENALSEGLSGITDLKIDFSGLEYISSAGLRVLLSAQKTMNKVGKMEILHPNADIREIFDITGFSDILTLVD